MIFRLISREVRDRAARYILNDAPDGWQVKVSEPTRNLEQNALLHALLSEIAATVRWGGHLQDVETWKRLLVGAWSRVKGEPVMMLPAVDGHGVELIYRRTSRLTKAECSDLIEYIKAWQAEHEHG